MSRFPLVLGFIALLTLPASAQENTVGLGVSIEPAFIAQNNTSTPALSMPMLYVPFTARGFRFEPSIGFSRFAASLGDDTDAVSTLAIGTGLFFYRLLSADNAWYIGSRVGLIRFGLSDSFDDDNPSRVDYYVATALGGEHYFGKLSIGVEGQVQYLWVGDFNDDSEVTRSLFQSRALVFFRYHFGSWSNS